MSANSHTQTLTADSCVDRAAVSWVMMTGMTSKSGKPYLTKLAEVQAVIRDTLKQRLQAA